MCGIGLLKLNWTTGDVGFSIINIGIPSFNVVRAGTYESIVLGLRFPLFAIWYWLKKRKQNIKEITNSEVKVVQPFDEIS